MAEPPDDAESEALAELDYSEAWLDSGLLDRATLLEQQRRMLAQSYAHFLIIALIILGNVIYFSSRKGS